MRRRPIRNTLSRDPEDQGPSQKYNKHYKKNASFVQKIKWVLIFLVGVFCLIFCVVKLGSSAKQTLVGSISTVRRRAEPIDPGSEEDWESANANRPGNSDDYREEGGYQNDANSYRDGGDYENENSDQNAANSYRDDEGDGYVDDGRRDQGEEYLEMERQGYQDDEFDYNGVVAEDDGAYEGVQDSDLVDDVEDYNPPLEEFEDEFLIEDENNFEDDVSPEVAELLEEEIKADIEDDLPPEVEYDAEVDEEPGIGDGDMVEFEDELPEVEEFDEEPPATEAENFEVELNPNEVQSESITDKKPQLRRQNALTNEELEDLEPVNE